MNFLDSFLTLCDRKDVTPCRALEDAGLSKSLYSKWKANPDFIPNGSTIEKLAKYFHVSYDALKGGNPFGARATGLEGMPEFEELVKAASKMSLATRMNVVSYAKFICPEAFDGE